MIPALAQVSSLNSPFETDIADYAAGQCPAIELWLGKLEGYLQDHTPQQVKDLLTEHGMTAPVASYQGGLLTTQGDARREHWEHFGRRLALCQELGIGTLVVALDTAGPLNNTDLQRLQVSLHDAARQARDANVRLALEFQAKASFGNNLETAAALVAEVDSPHLGLCLDMFHFTTGPSKLEDLGHLSPANLFHVQFCDLAGVPREMATDADRILPGDGDLLLAPVVENLQNIGYAGCVSIELMNPNIWHVPALQFGEIGMTALRKVLGQASMS
jgi:2-keto-myo-inositol isomerase